VLCRVISIITVSLIGAAIAEELPSELLLKCDLKQTGYSVYQGKPDYHEIQLSKTFRLKDRVFSLVDSRLPSGENCKLNDGQIECEFNATIPLDEVPGLQGQSRTEKRHSTVRLNRSTGELRLVLETWGYVGEGTKGKPNSTLNLIQTGVCRSIGKALF
jgi:hypothetical protein